MSTSPPPDRPPGSPPAAGQLPSNRSQWRRAASFLGTHPTKRTGLNRMRWLAALLVVFVVIGSAPSCSPKSKPTADRPTPTQTGSAAASPTASTRAVTTPAPSTAAKTKPSTSASPRPADATGGVRVPAPGVVLPNPARTPGATNPAVIQASVTSTICVSGWTATIRPRSSYTTTLKKQQLASGYAYHGDLNPADYEEDHLIPLELGGAPRSVRNLWPEPYAATEGARMKDQLENKLHELICDGQLRLATAQHAISANWFTAYQTYLGTPPAPGSSPRRSTPVATTTTAAAPPATTTAAAAPPANPLTCAASMSNPSPADYSTTDVIVHTGVAGATVTATAHYKTTDTTHQATADGNGVADIPFRISRATPGYTVDVDITATAHGATRYCSTSFTPR
jgi:hypothetical protein